LAKVFFFPCEIDDVILDGIVEYYGQSKLFKITTTEKRCNVIVTSGMMTVVAVFLPALALAGCRYATGLHRFFLVETWPAGLTSYAFFSACPHPSGAGTGDKEEKDHYATARLHSPPISSRIVPFNSDNKGKTVDMSTKKIAYALWA